ncbi:uncharacterized protein LOC127529990 [Octopus vulgaris]|uniref:Uncharacterized protein LOC127529990 n=1 Tax=Octopus vulgaris TaxID=6645 RepID=A0AA36EZ83_OCTVU|nr:uncharacterized protein LOC127529990 [Octopus vulgaris]
MLSLATVQIPQPLCFGHGLLVCRLERSAVKSLVGIHVGYQAKDDRMMAQSKEERIEIVLLGGREGWSYRKIAEEFNLRHTYRQPIYFTAVGKLIKKFKETGSVLDKPRSGRPKTSDETKEAVMAKVSASPKKSLRRTSTVLGVPKPTIHRMLVEEKFHRYNLQILHHLNEDDPDRRM